MTATPDRFFVFKQIGDVELRLHVFEPAGLRDGPPRPAIVFFFGGGWVNGTPTHFYPQSAHLASRGMVAMCAEYRVAERHGTSPKECVRDARSCLRWVRTHAGELHIDPARLAAGGGSAGGHIAACTAFDSDYNEPGDDLSVTPRPCALVLFNPVLDNGPGDYGHDRVGDYYKTFSPAYNLGPGLPPALLMLGTTDDLIPVATIKRYAARSRALGNRCELLLYEDQQHGFFNYKDGENPYFRQTLDAVDAFLVSLGLLSAAG
jgi:acetyl esterase